MRQSLTRKIRTWWFSGNGWTLVGENGSNNYSFSHKAKLFSHAVSIVQWIRGKPVLLTLSSHTVHFPFHTTTCPSYFRVSLDHSGIGGGRMVDNDHGTQSGAGNKTKSSLTATPATSHAQRNAAGLVNPWTPDLERFIPCQLINIGPNLTDFNCRL